jgi:rhodanese-related sulfurtransferase
MAGAVIGLATRQPAIHFTLAALGILPYWFPKWHPIDVLYNHLLRPLWKGVRLPSNPLPRRIACLMGGAMNLGIALSFVAGNNALAYGFGVVLIVLQLVVITTHFCVASWMFEGILRMFGRWEKPVAVAEAKSLVEGGGVLVDVRNPDEFATDHLEGARNAPLDVLPAGLEGAEETPLVLYCNSGLRCQDATRVLKKKGFLRVHILGARASWR